MAQPFSISDAKHAFRSIRSAHRRFVLVSDEVDDMPNSDSSTPVTRGDVPPAVTAKEPKDLVRKDARRPAEDAPRQAAGSRGDAASPPVRDIPVDWEALEDAFENNAPEVHSYLHLVTGDVLRVVDGVADPQMHARIAADTNYLRIDPVSSREQYRWMERYIPMVEDPELQGKLTQAIDGKGAFRRFKDVLMAYGPERERWFSFRSERLRIFMEAWLSAHALNPVARPVWVPEPVRADAPTGAPEPVLRDDAAVRETRRGRSAESLRKALRDIADALGPRDLDTLTTFAEFLKARRAARSFAQHTQPEGGGSDDAPESQETPAAGD